MCDTVDLCPGHGSGRDPRWPRMWESYGEDTYVNSQMAVASVLGFQGDDPNRVDDRHVAACIKHFMAYGVPVSGKDRTPSSVTRNVLREKYFAPFMECIRAGALSLMVNSASNGGMPFHADRELLTGWVKEELNWDGLIVTDWNDIYNLCERDHIAASVRMPCALRSMPVSTWLWYRRVGISVSISGNLSRRGRSPWSALTMR